MLILLTVEFLLIRFRRMCILSGCDYLPSLKGIGLARAFKFFSGSTDSDLNSVLYLFFLEHVTGGNKLFLVSTAPLQSPCLLEYAYSRNHFGIPRKFRQG
jgi:5'-3' exonuclease